MTLSELQTKGYKFYTGNTSYVLDNDDYNYAEQALNADHPDMVELYMCQPYFYSISENGVYASYMVMSAMSNENFSSLNSQITARASAVASQIRALYTSADTTDAAKILKAHDYYVALLQYDYSALNKTGEAAYYQYAHTAYASLVKGLAVCDGYAKGYMLVLKQLGFTDCYEVTGMAGGYGNMGGHAWTMIKLDDSKYYEEDTTWDDTVYTATHRWFNKTTSAYARGIAGSYHTRVSGYIGLLLPSATGTKYTYEFLASGASGSDNEEDEGEQEEEQEEENLPTDEDDDEESEIPVGSVISYGTGTYKVTDDDTVQYMRSPSTAKSLSIPGKVWINGYSYRVTSIGKNAFKGNKRITKLTIPSSVVSIGANALNGCSNLKTITINANKNLKIGSGAFKNLKKGSVIKVKGVSGKNKIRIINLLKKRITSSRTKVK